MADNVIVQHNAGGWLGTGMKDAVLVGGKAVALFASTVDAELFASALRKKQRELEEEELTRQRLCVICEKPMGALPFKYHEICPED